MIKIELRIKEDNVLNFKDKTAVKMDVKVKQKGIFPTDNEKEVSEILIKRISNGRRFDIIDRTKNKDFDELETILKSLLK